MLFIFSSAPFYTEYVHLPTADDSVPSHICNNPKFPLFFKDALAVIDGSHIHSAPPASERAFYRNHKGFLSQNCLFACSFNLKFVSSLTGWEGDAQVYDDAQSKDLHIPDGKYYLADAGFPTSQQLLTPYCGPWYHLAEWGHASIRYDMLYFLYYLLI
jgi:hypothetical protein